jgi:hypothetical protein
MGCRLVAVVIMHVHGYEIRISRTFQSLVIALLTNRFNIQKFRMVLTLPLCVLCGCQNNHQLLSCTALTHWFCMNEVESVYCVVCTESVYKRDTFFL